MRAYAYTKMALYKYAPFPFLRTTTCIRIAEAAYTHTDELTDPEIRRVGG